jgi:hypothetical protein
MKTIFLLFLLVTFLHFESSAQTDTLSPKQHSYLSLEIDPAPFVLGGYSLSVKYSPKKLSHLTFTGSVYASKFPDKLMSKVNYEKGFRDLQIETSYAGFVDYFLNRNRTSWHAGTSLFVYKKSVGMEGNSQRATFYTLYPNIRIGYLYQPFRKLGLYLNPWINLGSERNLDTNNILQGASFKANSIQYILALHIGYYLNFHKSK